MSIASLMRAVEAAGFATASGENDRKINPAPVSWQVHGARPLPKDVLMAAKTNAGEASAVSIWSRPNLTHLIPSWNSKA